MILYKINDRYPDKEFGFNLVGEDFGVASANHTHPFNQFAEIPLLLADKANANHTHTGYLKYFDVDSSNLTNVIELQSANTNLSLSADVEQNVITMNITFTMAEAGETSDGITNINPYARHTDTSISTTSFNTTSDNQVLLFLSDN